jgi:hypothetical protein
MGSPPERGAEAYTVRSGHVSAPNPRPALIKAQVFFVPGTVGHVSLHAGVRHFPMGVRTHC